MAKLTLLAQHIRQDVRVTLRVLRRSPGVAVLVAASLSLGIGANTAVFSFIDFVVLRMLPVWHPKELVVVRWSAQTPPTLISSYRGPSGCPPTTARAFGCSFSYPTLKAFQESGIFGQVFGVAGPSQVIIRARNVVGMATAEAVSGTYFSTLGIRPILGRALTVADDTPGAVPVAVVGYGLWETRLGGDPSILGKTVSINKIEFLVVGVAPPSFMGLQPGWKRDLWIPLPSLARIGSFPTASTFDQRDAWWLMVIGRLRPGISEAQASAALEGNLRGSLPFDVPSGSLPRVDFAPAGRGLASLRSLYAESLKILMAVVGIVLLLACVNITIFLLVRAASRQQEIAVRLALGASRSRIAGLLLTESVLLALLGGGAGLLVAHWMISVLAAMVTSGPFQVALEPTMNFRVLIFTAFISMLTALGTGLAPAIRSSRMNLTPVLNSVSGPAPRRRVFSRFSPLQLLVVAQVALTLPLVTGAGCFLQTLQNLRKVDLGMQFQNILLFGVDAQQGSAVSQRSGSFYKDLLDRLQSLPGVTSASLSRVRPLSGSAEMTDISIDGYTPSRPQGVAITVARIGPGFFETLRIPLLMGREFSRDEHEIDARVAIVNEATARQYFGNLNAVGRLFRWGKSNTVNQVVGVVKDSVYSNLRELAPPVVYLPYMFDKNSGEAQFEVRITSRVSTLVPSVREALRQLDPDVPMRDVETLSDEIDQSLFQERMFAKLSGAFGIVSLLLAGVGLNGVLASAVTRRTGEIGVRMALGATSRDVVRLVIGEISTLLATGLVVGVPLALASQKVLANMFFEVDRSSLVTLMLAVAVLIATAVAAGYVPARRAASTDPWLTMRSG